MLYITLDEKRNLKLYKNNELLGYLSGLSSNLPVASSCFLTNYVQDEILQTMCNQPEILEDKSLEEFIEDVKGNQGKYIQNILVIQGTLSEDVMYFINNLMDTNY